jgi:hypothetical protein
MKSKIKVMKIRIKNCKRRGEWAELEFIAAAAKRDLRVSKPMGDSASYDAVIETNGHFVRVQVKSTTCLRPGNLYKCNIRPSTGRPYKRRDFDFLAAYVIPEGVWYIIPARLVLNGQRIAIMLNTTNPTSRWAPYKEAWDLLCNHRSRVAL